MIRLGKKMSFSSTTSSNYIFHGIARLYFIRLYKIVRTKKNEEIKNKNKNKKMEKNQRKYIYYFPQYFRIFRNFYVQFFFICNIQAIFYFYRMEFTVYPYLH